MTKQEIAKEIAQINDFIQGRGGLASSDLRPIIAIRASLETAFQLAKLNEAIESGATITIRPPDGRKFR